MPRRSASLSRPPTLGDVANLAGVSRSTVSNVVRGSDVVAPQTRKRVMAAVEQLRYRPNALARQLLRGRSDLIGIVALELRNPFLAEMASLVEREVTRFGFGAMFCTTEGDPAREDRAISLMLDNRVSGIVFLSYLDHPAQIAGQVAGRAATVFIAAIEPWSDSVSVDERRSGEMVARHLLQLGHRRLAFVSPNHRDTADRLRFEGFARSVVDAGGEVTVIQWDAPDGQILVGDSKSTWDEFLRTAPRFTGVFASNDFTAIDLLDVCDRVGLSVPADLSVVGFDDVPAASLRRVNLTTIRQPRQELVRLGIEAMIGRIEGRIVGPPLVTLAGASLQVRGTTGPAARRVSIRS